MEEYKWNYDFRVGTPARKRNAKRTRPTNPPAPAQKTAAPSDGMPKAAPEPVDPSALSDSAAQLYKVLTHEPKPVDELTVQAGLSPRETLAAITELEMMGLLSAMPGKQYGLK